MLLKKEYYLYLCALKNGGLAHLVERQVRNLKVAGSSPVSSTKVENQSLRLIFFLLGVMKR